MFILSNCRIMTLPNHYFCEIKRKKTMLPMKMISRFIAVFLFVLSISAQAQVGINSTGANSDGSAMLDVSGANKGLLQPWIALTVCLMTEEGTD